MSWHHSNDLDCNKSHGKRVEHREPRKQGMPKLQNSNGGRSSSQRVTESTHAASTVPSPSKRHADKCKSQDVTSFAFVGRAVWGPNILASFTPARGYNDRPGATTPPRGAGEEALTKYQRTLRKGVVHSVKRSSSVYRCPWPRAAAVTAEARAAV